MGGGANVEDTPVATLHALEAELTEVCGHLNLLHARMVQLVGEALDAKAWVQWGIHTPAHWLAWQTGLSPSRARAIVRIAERRAELPATIAALDAGELAVDQVTPIAARVPAWAEAEVAELAHHATVSQLQRVVSKYPFHKQVPPPDDPPPAPPPPDHEVETLSLYPDDDGMWRLSAKLNAEQGRLLDAALREANDALFRRDGQRATLVEALTEIAQRSLDSIESTSRRDRYRIHLHVEADGTCTDDQGRHVPDWLRRLAGCDCTLTTEWERHGRPVRVGTPEQAIPAVTRRYIIRRDRHCRLPGCTSRFVDVHHVIHREDGGTHHVENLVCLCPRHHRQHHKGLIGIAGNADTPLGLVFTDRWGDLLKPVATPRPPTGPPPRPATPYKHPLGERLDTTAVCFNSPPEHRARHAAQVRATVAAAQRTGTWYIEDTSSTSWTTHARMSPDD
jgi:5-methylcytosine-specific restriction endonuclease McrA